MLYLRVHGQGWAGGQVGGQGETEWKIIRNLTKGDEAYFCAWVGRDTFAMNL